MVLTGKIGVPVSELESRITELSNNLAEAGIEAALIQSPVDLSTMQEVDKTVPYSFQQ